MTVKTVPVTLPDWLWGRLATIADERDQEIGGLIADAVRNIIDTSPRIQFERVSQLGILERELIAAKAAGHRAPGTHT